MLKYLLFTIGKYNFNILVKEKKGYFKVYNKNLKLYYVLQKQT